MGLMGLLWKSAFGPRHLSPFNLKPESRLGPRKVSAFVVNNCLQPDSEEPNKATNYPVLHITLSSRSLASIAIFIPCTDTSRAGALYIAMK